MQLFLRSPVFHDLHIVLAVPQAAFLHRTVDLVIRLVIQGGVFPLRLGIPANDRHLAHLVQCGQIQQRHERGIFALSHKGHVLPVAPFGHLLGQPGPVKIPPDDPVHDLLDLWPQSGQIVSVVPDSIVTRGPEYQEQVDVKVVLAVQPGQYAGGNLAGIPHIAVALVYHLPFQVLVQHQVHPGRPEAVPLVELHITHSKSLPLGCHSGEYESRQHIILQVAVYDLVPADGHQLGKLHRGRIEVVPDSKGVCGSRRCVFKTGRSGPAGVMRDYHHTHPPGVPLSQVKRHHRRPVSRHGCGLAVTEHVQGLVLGSDAYAELPVGKRSGVYLQQYARQGRIIRILGDNGTECRHLERRAYLGLVLVLGTDNGRVPVNGLALEFRELPILAVLVDGHRESAAVYQPVTELACIPPDMAEQAPVSGDLRSNCEIAHRQSAVQGRRGGGCRLYPR